MSSTEPGSEPLPEEASGPEDSTFKAPPADDASAPGEASTLSGMTSSLWESFGASKDTHRGASDVIRELKGRIAPKDWAKLPLPTEVGPFEVQPEKTLGRGGMGVVVRGRHQKTGRRVAIKFAPRMAPAFAMALEEEGRMLAKIEHPHVLQVLDFGRTDTHVWIATEYVAGQSLRTWLDGRHGDVTNDFEVDTEAPGRETTDHRLPIVRDEVSRILVWFRDMARALHELHEADVLHRDVKPGNILVANDGRAKLIDFGLATAWFDPDALAKGLAGTLRYMSPEQLHSGYSHLRPASDVYSLAVTFYEALTDRAVVPPGSEAETIEHVAFQRPPPPSRVNPDLPRDLDPLFAKALRKDPKARYQSAEELAEDLDLLLEDHPLKHAEIPAAHSLVSGIRRRRFVLLGALVAVLALVGGGLWWSAQRARADVVSRLETHLDALETREALALARRHRDRYGEDPAFRALDARAVDLANREIMEESLGRLVTSIVKPSGEHWLSPLRDAAARDLEAHPRATAPRLVLALWQFLQADWEGLSRTVAPIPERSEDHSAARELQAFTLLAAARDAARRHQAAPGDEALAGARSAWSRYFERQGELARRDPESRTAWCLRAARAYQAYQVIVEGSPPLPEALQHLRQGAWTAACNQETRDVGTQLARLSGLDPDTRHLGLESLRALINLHTGNFLKALSGFDGIDAAVEDREARRGSRTRAVAALFLLHSQEGRIGKETFARATSYLGDIPKEHPAVLPYLGKLINALGYRVLRGWEAGEAFSRYLRERWVGTPYATSAVLACWRDLGSEAFLQGAAVPVIARGEDVAAVWSALGSAEARQTGALILLDALGARLMKFQSDEVERITAAETAEVRAFHEGHSAALAALPLASFYRASFENAVASKGVDEALRSGAREEARRRLRAYLALAPEGGGVPAGIGEADWRVSLEEARSLLEALKGG